MLERIEVVKEYLTKNWDRLENYSIDKEIENCKYICIFGTGDWFTYAIQSYEPFISRGVDFLCDNDSAKWGTMINGVKCISPDELVSYKEEVFVFVAIKNPQPIFEQLRSIGIVHMNIVNPWLQQKYENNRFEDIEWRDNLVDVIDEVCELYEDEWSRETLIGIMETRYLLPPEYENYSRLMVSKGDDYFWETPIGSLITDGEDFVDIGAYTGDTVKSFLSKVDNKFSCVYCFELDKSNYKLLDNWVDSFDDGLKNRIKLYNFGLGNHDESIFYKPCKELTKVVKNGDMKEGLVEGKIKRLDNILGDRKVSMMKLDVEGMEIDVLLGAENIIRLQKPKLAISVYHKNADIWEIPKLIKRMNSDYKLYLRHQACINASTILYCI